MTDGSSPALSEIPLDDILQRVERLDVRGPRYTSYPTVPVWPNDDATEPRAAAWRALRQRGKPVGVYVHLPFCRSRCLYCGCNSVITQRTDRMRRYLDALEQEIGELAAALGGDVPHEQLHLGGGTPTHLHPGMLAELVDLLLAQLGGTPTAERSVEVDPRVTLADHLWLLSERGFRRVSIGVQDLDPQVQQAVHRPYGATDLEGFIDLARKAGFTGVNVDLIYGLPRQTPETWRATLETIAAMQPDRLACFGFAYLPKRLAHQRALVEDELPSPRQRVQMLIEANLLLTARGYEAIGLDHFAKPDDELAVARRQGALWRNFMGYTTTRGLELCGLGSSGISELDELFVQNEVDPERYGERIAGGRSTIVRQMPLDADDRFRKQLINHLMCNLEIDWSAPPGAGDAPVLADDLAAAQAALRPYEAEGLIVPTAQGYRVTPLGQLFLRNLAMVFDRYLPRQTTTTFSRTV